jgi:dTMP kinase
LRNLFIVFEGIDGSGKSVQVKMLAGVLRKHGHDVEVCREPGGTEMGEFLRKELLHSSLNIAPETEALLYAASRAQLTADVIRPALKRGRIVISDRFSDSTLAYQGYGRGLDINMLKLINRLATGGLKPDLSIILDLPPELIADRLSGQADRLEREEIFFFQKVRQGYLSLAREQPGNYLVLNACLTVEEIHHQIFNSVKTLLHS